MTVKNEKMKSDEENLQCKNKIVAEICRLGSYEEYSRDYEQKIIQLIHSIRVDFRHDQIDKVLNEIIEDKSEKIAYGAFYALCSMYRRNKHFSRYYQLVGYERYSKKFNKFISFGHLKSMCLIEMVKTRGEIVKAIEISKNVIEKVEALKCGNAADVNFGFYHSYAVNVVRGFEDGFLSIPNDSAYLKHAKSYVDISINCDNSYAKFYATLGRLHIIEKNYDDAEMELRTAIELEENSESDYAIRVNEYQNYILVAKTSKNIERLNKTVIVEAKKEVEEIRTRNIEVISFFVAIMSFVIGGIQLANASTTFIDKSALIILLFGCLLMILGTFGYNLAVSDKKNYTLSIFIGLIMIMSSFGVHMFIK